MAKKLRINLVCLRGCHSKQDDTEVYGDSIGFECDHEIGKSKMIVVERDGKKEQYHITVDEK